MLSNVRKIPVLFFLLIFMAGAAPVSSLLASDNCNKSIFPFKKSDISKRLKKYNGITCVNVREPLPCLSDCEYLGLNLENLYRASLGEIIPIEKEIGYSDFSSLPSEYEIWDTYNVNPYKVSLVDMTDTIKIDVSNYCPPSTKHVTSNFGFRKWRHHNGIDLKVHKGDTVKCAFDGVVRMTRYDRRGYGYFTVVRHSNGLETLYGHLSRFIAGEGDVLKAGDPIGLGGSTGRSTGYHLHLEIRYLGNPINPNDIIDFKEHRTRNRVFMLTADNFKYKKEIDKIRYWTVKKGDTLGRISMKTGVSISKLCSLNGITRKTILRIGRRIRYT